MYFYFAPTSLSAKELDLKRIYMEILKNLHIFVTFKISLAILIIRKNLNRFFNLFEIKQINFYKKKKILINSLL